MADPTPPFGDYYREIYAKGMLAGERPAQPISIAELDLTWDDLEWLQGTTTLPLVLKGILLPDDAREARERGVDRIVVSNHGGRQLAARSPRSRRCRRSPARSAARSRSCSTAASAPGPTH